MSPSERVAIKKYINLNPKKVKGCTQNICKLPNKG